MYCSNCGAKVEEGAKFCKKCGSQIKKIDFLIGEDTKTKIEHISNNNSKKPNKKKKRFIVTIIIIIVLIVSFLLAKKYYFNKRKIEVPEMNVEDFLNEPIDADEYYSNIGELLSSHKVSESKSLFSESAISIELENRGFNVDEIYYEYDVDGNYTGKNSINKSFESYHPVYNLLYESENEIWSISVVENEILVYPVLFNLENKNAKLYFSETSSIMSYDSTKNKFYKIIPNHNEAIIVTIEKINKEVLDSISSEEMSKYYE